MQKDTKVLNLILKLIKRIEDDWTEELDNHNLWIDVEDFYNEIMRKNDRWVANVIFAFIVLSYDASSDYLTLTMDRIANKRSVMKRLAGPSYQTNQILVEAVLGDSDQTSRGIIDKTIEWYIERQKDWRWGEILSNIEFHSRGLALSQGANAIKEMKEAGSMKETATLLREKADVFLDNIRKEFVDLDTVIEKEGRVKLTERLKNDHSSWELFILMKNNKEKDLEELNKAANISVVGEDEEA